MGRRTVPASENQGLNQASSLCGLICLLDHVVSGVLHSHWVRRGSHRPPGRERGPPGWLEPVSSRPSAHQLLGSRRGEQRRPC